MNLHCVVFKYHSRGPIRTLRKTLKGRGGGVGGGASSVWAYGVVVSMFDFHRSDRSSNPGRGGKIS